MQAGRPVVARVLSVEPHPNADKLRVCSLDAGGSAPIRVVTNATEVSAGSAVFVAVSLLRLPCPSLELHVIEEMVTFPKRMPALVVVVAAWGSLNHAPGGPFILLLVNFSSEEV